MKTSMTYDEIKCIVGKIFNHSSGVSSDSGKITSESSIKGRKFAYHESLDTIKNWMTVYEKKFPNQIATEGKR